MFNSCSTFGATSGEVGDGGGGGLGSGGGDGGGGEAWAAWTDAVRETGVPSEVVRALERLDVSESELAMPLAAASVVVVDAGTDTVVSEVIDVTVDPVILKPEGALPVSTLAVSPVPKLAECDACTEDDSESRRPLEKVSEPYARTVTVQARVPVHRAVRRSASSSLWIVGEEGLYLSGSTLAVTSAT